MPYGNSAETCRDSAQRARTLSRSALYAPEVNAVLGKRAKAWHGSPRSRVFAVVARAPRRLRAGLWGRNAKTAGGGLWGASSDVQNISTAYARSCLPAHLPPPTCIPRLRSSSLLLDLAALAAYPLTARAALAGLAVVAACQLTAVGARCLPARRLPAHRRRRPLPTRSPLALPSPPASSPPSTLAARRPPSLSALVPHASSSLTPLPSRPRCLPRRLPPCPVNTGACLTPAPPPSCPLPALPRPRPACQNTSPAHCDHPSCRAMTPSSSPLFASTHSRAPCRAGAPAGPAPSAAASFL
ncbi:hypothetical protein ACG7TL_001764 [Trametes sanguinea]